MIGGIYPGETYPGGDGPAIASGAVTVALPVLAITAAAPIPTVSGGAVVALLPLALAAAAPAPTPAGGATVALPVLLVAAAAPVPSVAAGATTALPALGVAFTAPAPSLAGDTSVALPVLTIAVAAPAPAVSAAVVVPLPIIAASIAVPPPSLSEGAGVALPVLTVTVTALAPSSVIGGGGEATVGLAPVRVTLGAYTFTTRSSVRIGLPRMTVRVGAPAGWFMDEKPHDFIAAHVYDVDGLTQLARLQHVQAPKWREVLNQAGNASFQVPDLDASTALVTEGRIVKLGWYRDGIRVAEFACVVQAHATQFAVNGRRWKRFENQPGVMGLLNFAVMFPEYGYDGFGVENRQTGTERHMGYMSASGGPWFIDTNWVPPRAVPWGTGKRKKQPADFHTFDPTAQWCSIYGPDTDQPAAAQCFGRDRFFSDEPSDVQIVCAFDDLGDLWVDGQPIITADRTQHNAWTQAQVVTVRVSAGEHVLAVYARNSPYVSGHDNPVAFIYSVRKLDTKGNPTGPVLTNSKPESCLVNDGTPEPAYRGAQILLRLFAEAADLGVTGITTLQHGWTDDDDSDGNPWTDLQAFAEQIGTTLYDIAARFTEHNFDLRVDPATMTLHAYKRLGTYLPDVPLRTGHDGGNLKSYELTTTPVKYTALLGQITTGEWVYVQDDDAVAARGLIVSSVNLGTVDTVASARVVLARMLEPVANPLIAVTADTALFSPIPYIDCDLGDTIPVPGDDGATLKMRITALTVDGTNPTIHAFPELVEDRSV